VVLQPGDVTNHTSIEAAVGAIVAKIGGKIDIFFNNASKLPKEAAVIGYPESEVRRSFEINLIGSFNALQGAAYHSLQLNSAILRSKS
jgi:NAD(P)-dependent dehydrogenase (short-subunit alcohol dehydrogenase family)